MPSFFSNNDIRIHKDLSTLKMSNKLVLQNSFNEYIYIPKTKKALEKCIGLCNLKLRENEIKKRKMLILLIQLKNFI